MIDNNFALVGTSYVYERMHVGEIEKHTNYYVRTRSTYREYTFEQKSRNLFIHYTIALRESFSRVFLPSPSLLLRHQLWFMMHEREHWPRFFPLFSYGKNARIFLIQIFRLSINEKAGEYETQKDVNIMWYERSEETRRKKEKRIKSRVSKRSQATSTKITFQYYYNMIAVTHHV